MGELSKLPNIGAKLEAQLNDTGIQTQEQLMAVGSKAAWKNILQTDPSACYMRLCSLEGALQGIRWHNLPQETKDDLKAYYQAEKQKNR